MFESKSFDRRALPNCHTSAPLNSSKAASSAARLERREEPVGATSTAAMRALDILEFDMKG